MQNRTTGENRMRRERKKKNTQVNEKKRSYSMNQPNLYTYLSDNVIPWFQID